MESRARAKRRAAEIHAYVGENGGGKSFAAIYDTIVSLKQGRRVAGTVLMLDPDREASCEAEADEAWAALGIHQRPTRPLALPHPLWTPITRWSHLLNLKATDVLLDEVQGIVNSRSHTSLPPAVMNQIHQMRRADNIIRWTTPAYARADVSLREVTKAVTYCVGLMPEPVHPCDDLCEEDHEHTRARLWGANRLFLWRTFDALSFDEFTSSDVRNDRKRENLKKLTRQFVWRPRTDVTKWYDTFADVLSILDVTEGGSCLTCGGTRRRPKCSCDDHDAGEERTRSGAPQPAPERRAA